MRLFTAIDPPDDARDLLSALQQATSLAARWTDPEQFHVTLRFLGDVPSDQAERINDALGRIQALPVTCRPYGLDLLPSRHNPRVLIVGLKRSDALLDLYRKVSDAIEAHGLEPDDRPFRPHITLARLDDVSPEDVHAVVTATDTSSLEPFTVNAFHLYESTLTSEGAVHDRRASFSLSG